jgi:hypothetical protein
VIVISGHGNIETAVTATKLGAFDFIEKPFSLDGLLHVVDRALESRPIAGGIDAEAVAADEAGAVALERRLLARPWPWTQRTIQRSVVVNGQACTPASAPGSSCSRYRPERHRFGNISNAATIPARIEYVDSTGYATTLYHNGIVAKTVEHLLAALHGYRITNLLVKMQSEIPISTAPRRSSAR